MLAASTKTPSRWWCGLHGSRCKAKKDFSRCARNDTLNNLSSRKEVRDLEQTESLPPPPFEVAQGMLSSAACGALCRNAWKCVVIPNECEGSKISPCGRNDRKANATMFSILRHSLVRDEGGACSPLRFASVMQAIQITKKQRAGIKLLPFVARFNRKGIYLPVRANECTQPCIRLLAFWMSFSLNHFLRSTLSTG
jgi:hypothetical protein